MAPSTRDRISVDLRGLRAVLFARARERGLTPSDLVRGLLSEALGAAAQRPTSEPSGGAVGVVTSEMTGGAALISVVESR